MRPIRLAYRRESARLIASLALALLAVIRPCAGGAAPRDSSPRPVLTGWASMPADTFRDGPPSGQFNERGERAAVPRFASQPVQGVSSIKPAGAPGEWWALSDNGFGAKWNSSDYELAIYRLAVKPRTRQRNSAKIELIETVVLRDPERRFPYRLTHEDSAMRTLTGADADPESLVVGADGSFWIGDELGPWLLHFSRDGRLLAAPIDLPDELRSPQHPLVLAGKVPATVGVSRGLEGLATTADGALLLALESPLASDVANGRGHFLRVYRYDIARDAFAPGYLRLPLALEATSLGEITHAGGGRYLVIERDDHFGADARYKRIRRWRLDESGATDEGIVVDLLNLADPHALAGTRGSYRMPYSTIEAVYSLDPRTVVVVNDNNYPATGARGTHVKDVTEWAWITLPASRRTANRSND